MRGVTIIGSDEQYIPKVATNIVPRQRSRGGVIEAAKFEAVSGGGR